MKHIGWLLACFGMVSSASGGPSPEYETDVIRTSAGDLTITFLGHGSLMGQFGDLTIHVDPFGQVADYGRLPKGDLVLITHEHADHLDPDALAAVRGAQTTVVLTATCARKVDGGVVMNNGDVRTLLGIPIEAVPAYNLRHTRDGGQVFHPKGIGNGYILTFGDTRVYIAGDTEDIPEMKSFKDITIAFLPMNLPYTMTPEMVADATRMLRPKILYPYHYGDTDPARIVELLKDEPQTEVRIRSMR